MPHGANEWRTTPVTDHLCKSLVLAAAGVFLFSACQPEAVFKTTDAPRANRCTDESWRETKILLGMGGFDNSPLVTEDDLMSFVHESVAPKFNSGFSLTRGIGAWTENTDTPHPTQPSAILMIMHPNAPDPNNAVRFLAEDYVIRFNQPATLMSWSDRCGEFVKPEEAES